VPGWGVAPDVGATSWMAWYDPPLWRLTSVSYQRAVRPAEVHGLDGVEIETLDWDSSDPHWKPGHTHYVRLTESTFEWLAFSHIRNGRRILYTFLDEGFDEDWGESPRRLEDTGRLVLGEDGTYALMEAPAETAHIDLGAGMFRLRIDERRFTCLRAVEFRAFAKKRASMERSILAESFFTRSGRLVLFRRYNGRLWKTQRNSPYAGQPWDEKFPDNDRLVINGAVFVHWYDCLTDVSCGFDTAGRARRRKD